VRAGTGTAPLEPSWHAKRAAHVDECERVELPRLAVEIASEKPAAVVRQQRIDADRLVSAEMLLDCLVAQAQVCVPAVATPTTCDRRDIAVPAGARTLPANRVHVLASAKETPYKRDLLRRS